MKTIHTVHPTSSLTKSMMGTAAAIQHGKLVKQSQRLVAQTFFGTMLKQMRDSPFKSKIFDGGRGGEVFQSMLDQHLADHMATGVGKKFVNAMVNKIEHPRKQPEPAEKAARQELFKRSGYSKQPAGNRRPYVPADFRA